MASIPKDKIIKLGNKEFAVQVSEFQGEARLDVRELYRDDNDRPAFTKKGVNIPLTEVPKLLARIAEVVGAVATPAADDPADEIDFGTA